MPTITNTTATPGAASDSSLANAADVARKIPLAALATPTETETFPGTLPLADIPVFTATVDGRAKLAAGYFNEATVDAKFAADSIDGQDRLKPASITTSRVAAGALSADAAGRALMATGYFDETTATAKFAAQAIATAPLKDAAITTSKLGPAAVTPAKAALTGVKRGTFVGAAAPGAITLTGAAVGDRVGAVYQIGTSADKLLLLTGAATVQPHAGFEAAITVLNQIQQVAATDESGKIFAVELLPASA